MKSPIAYKVTTSDFPGWSMTTRVAKVWPFTYLAMHFDSEHGPPDCRFLFAGRILVGVGPEEGLYEGLHERAKTCQPRASYPQVLVAWNPSERTIRAEEAADVA